MSRFTVASFGTCLAAVAVSLFALSTPVSANLLLNGSFEDIPAAPTFGQGNIPPEWTQVGISADTYSKDNSYGLAFGDFGHFADMTDAQDGIRFVAGADFGGSIQEGFGQLLSAPLTAGDTYTFSAYLYQDNPGFDAPAGYEILLSDAPDYNDADAVSLGITAATTGVAAWEFRDIVFTAPANAASLPWFILRQRSMTPTDQTYPAIDNLQLNLGAVAVPEPTSLALLGAAGVVAVVARRRKVA